MTEAPTPAYADGSLASVLPAVAGALGVDSPVIPATPLTFPACRRAVVVLVDGLGADQLARRGGHAPFLRSLLPQGLRLPAGFPSTTATSMGSFGTGLPPGAHGLLGYEVLVPGEDRTFNELSWEGGPRPETWQPHPTVFETVATEGVGVTRVGPAFFDGSGLTRASQRGGAFRAADSLAGRVDATLQRLRSERRSLVYLYWGELDKAGHTHGPDAWEWGLELEHIDGELRRLAASVPDDTAVVVTADHGMVDVPFGNRIDLVDEPALREGVRHVGGEPRALHLYCETGAVDATLARWRGRLGDDAWISTRAASVEAGWFGPVEERNRARIGDVVVALRAGVAVVDSQRMRPRLLALKGLHGSLTEDEVAVPVLVLPARAES